ncbi:hypothetical protein RB608_11930 [Nocardioides sp. LHD-245]|uniref:hypothetical protein n=1 Tax=Nocardioides sp. LHD-245 TaxID=3051387 RepID=UPI0027DF6797|nr:hypothetical protein [Nocardioides sp. LHD-245]
MGFNIDIAVAFMVLAFLAVTAGVLLLNVPAGLIAAGLMLAAAGIALLPTGADKPERPRGGSTKGR